MSMRVSRKPNGMWKRFMLDRAVTTTVADAVVSRQDRFFVMGSCFAEEIRSALDRELGAGQVVPDYRALQFDPARAQVDSLPERNHLNTYNVFSVLQEIERILHLWQPEPDDFWQLDGKVQCPYRRLVLADTPQMLAEVGAGLDAVLRAGFQAADHFIFTFGMTEVFRNRRTGKVANQKPGYGKGGGKDETTYHRASFVENLMALDRLVGLIGAQKPKARIFVTVSPVPLHLTFSGEDVFVANSLSKSTLRAALGEVAAARPNVRYFPSYEAVMAAGPDAWERDGRHVRRALVEQITRSFVEANLRA